VTRPPTNLELRAEKVTEILVAMAAVVDPKSDYVIEALLAAGATYESMLLVEVAARLAHRVAAPLTELPVVHDEELSERAEILARKLAVSVAETRATRRH
jgi:hypothetical protein